jgi:very-short-patch-repair endonuclease
MPRTRGVTQPDKPEIFKTPLSDLLGLRKNQPPPYGEVPPDFPGSTAEWAIYWALNIMNIQFEYQVPLFGGRLQAGGVIADFVIPSHMLVIRVQGEHWHYEMGMEVVNMDAITKMQMEDIGYLVIDIDESHCLKDPKFYVSEALRGISHSRAEKGY